MIKGRCWLNDIISHIYSSRNVHHDEVCLFVNIRVNEADIPALFNVLGPKQLVLERDDVSFGRSAG